MSVYVITMAILLIFSYVDVSFRSAILRNSFLTLVFVLFVLQAGLRWEMGTDWIPYQEHFDRTTTFETVLIGVVTGFELGYGLSVLAVRTLTDNYSIFLLLHAFIFYILVVNACCRVSPFPIIALLLFYALTIGLLGSNRQLIALAICLYSLKYIFGDNVLKFIICVSLATMFHTSAILFSVYYFLNRDFGLVPLIVLLVLSVIIGLSPVPQTIFQVVANSLGDTFVSKADYYNDNTNLVESSLSVFGLFRRIAIFLLAVITYKVVTEKYPILRLVYNGYYFGLVIYFLFANSLLIVVNRGSLYFSVMEAIILSSMPIALKARRSREISVLIIFAYAILAFYLSISGYSDLFLPYQGVFVNESYSRYLY